MADLSRTEGEQRFEEYLNAMGYAFEREKPYPGKKKKPDYTVTHNGVFLAEVKDADPYLPEARFGQFDPHEKIVERLNAARKQLGEYKEFPCCVVLQNNGNVHMDIEHPAVVLGVMYGRIAWSVPVYVGDGPPPKEKPSIERVFGRGAEMQPNKNTTISALVTLRRIGVGQRRLRRIRQDNPSLSFEEGLNVAAERFGPDFFGELQQGVIVWENAYARIPLSRELFRGPYDERYGLDGSDITRVFCGSAFEEFDTSD
jgi:hypothetical protein